MHSSHKILLVDDDPDDQFLFREALLYADEDADFLVASNGEKALTLLNGVTEPPDLVFLDLNMPLMNGVECLQAVRKDKRWTKLPVVIYSTTVSQEYAEELGRAGATAVLTKPNDFLKLCSMLQSMIVKFDGGLYSHRIVSFPLFLNWCILGPITI